jgi:hypothetical protein
LASTKWTYFPWGIMQCALNPCHNSLLDVGSMAINCLTLISTFLVLNLLMMEYGIRPTKMENSYIHNCLKFFHFPFSWAISFIFFWWEFSSPTSLFLLYLVTMRLATMGHTSLSRVFLILEYSSSMRFPNFSFSLNDTLLLGEGFF